MKWYSQVVIPRLCDFFLGSSVVASQRAELLANASGNVLEIGFGTGLNLPHYPSSVRKLTVVDPNPGMNRLAQKRIEQSTIEVQCHVTSCEHLPFDSDALDCVVSTFTLCSIENVDKALGEVFRVLKPGGRFLFLEHGLSPEPRVQKWQRRLNWLQMRLGDGCHLDRDIGNLVAARPFAAPTIDHYYMPGVPWTHGYMYRGQAVK